MARSPVAWCSYVLLACLTSDQIQPFLRGADAAFELGVFGEGEHFFEARAGRVAGGDEIAAGDEERGADFFLRQLFPSPFGEFVEREIAMAGERVDAMQREVLVELRQAEETLQG